MTRPYLARPQAKRDIIRHARYIARDDEVAAMRFRHVAEATFEIVTVTPRGGTPTDPTALSCGT